jgi:L-asparagine transporter-like permease
MITGTFAFSGTELVGCCWSSQNRRRTIPQAIRLAFWRILFFYVLSIFLLGLIILTTHHIYCRPQSHTPQLQRLRSLLLMQLHRFLRFRVFLTVAFSFLCCIRRTLTSISGVDPRQSTKKSFGRPMAVGFRFQCWWLQALFASWHI